MYNSVFVKFTSEIESPISIDFLVDINRLEQGFISSLTNENKPFIMMSLYINEISTDIDNEYFVFNTLYKALKKKDKEFLQTSLTEDEFKVIWENKKSVKNLIKSLRNKYPELKKE